LTTDPDPDAEDEAVEEAVDEEAAVVNAEAAALAGEPDLVEDEAEVSATATPLPDDQNVETVE
jgi:hypothetical protein